jgi:SAM-dependent methyltransferase
VYAGYYPSDSATAIAHLERLRERGAGYFLVPASCGWWLRHYRELREHLDSRYQLAAEDASCVLYRLDRVGTSVVARDPERGDDLGAQLEHLRATLAATGAWVGDLAPRVAATHEQVAVIPDVLRDAFSTVAQAVAAVEGDVDDARVEIAELVARVGAIEKQRAIAPRVETRSLPAGPSAAEPRELAENTARTAALAVATVASVGSLERAEQHIEQQLAARPYMSTDRFSTGDPDRPMGFSRGDGREDERAQRPTFADVFRGEPSFIADRQRIYLPLLRNCERVVDLGSGRGEFLDLLAEAGIEAEGVEQDGSLVRACRRRGLSVREQDALEFLEQVEPACLDGVFSAQFIEHVDPERLGDLVVLARRALCRNGMFIAETVNPENHEALKTFHVDLTHQRPIFPQVLLHLCWEAGFDAAWIFYPLGGGFTQRRYDAVGEYAVVARA